MPHLGVYVDDIIAAGLDPAIILKVEKFLKPKFKLKDLDDLKCFLSLKIERSSSGIAVS